MRYLVASDLHGDIISVKLLLSIFQREHIDKIILLGDLYNNGFSFDKEEVRQLLNNNAENIICTRGNCDTDFDIEKSKFVILDKLVLKIKNKVFMFSHGDRYKVDNIEEELNIDYFIYGHTHKNDIYKMNNITAINLSSLSFPRGYSKRSYMIIDESIKIYDYEGNLLDCIVI